MGHSRSPSPTAGTARHREREPAAPRERDRDRERRRRRSRDRTDISARRRRSPEREHRDRERHPRSRSRSRSRSGSKGKDGKTGPSAARPPVSVADLEGKSPDEQEMMKMMGFCAFDTTKGKKVTGNEVGTVHVILKRKYRQYMNRKGGFNRPLDFVA